MSTPSAAFLRRPGAPPAGAVAVALVGALTLAALLHVGIGARFVAPADALRAIVAYDPANFDHQVIVRLRLPRLLAALLVGASLGLAGAVIQSLTRNPLADPGTIGMNAGAALAVVLSVAFFGLKDTTSFAAPWIAATGATIAFGLVMAIGSAGRSGPTPLKLTLAGVAIGALAGSLTSAILVLDEGTLETIRVWRAGNLAGRPLGALVASLAPMAIGATISFLIALRLNALALGDKAAAGLGVGLRGTRLAALAAVALLTGAAVAAVGSIGFIGLVVPHAVKMFVRPDNRLVLPLAALAGAFTLVSADILARTLIAPQEIATGLITALIGAPVFVLLVRTRL